MGRFVLYIFSLCANISVLTVGSKNPKHVGFMVFMLVYCTRDLPMQAKANLLSFHYTLVFVLAVATNIIVQ